MVTGIQMNDAVERLTETADFVEKALTLKNRFISEVEYILNSPDLGIGNSQGEEAVRTGVLRERIAKYRAENEKLIAQAPHQY
jgi:hypothetical protein